MNDLPLQKRQMVESQLRICQRCLSSGDIKGATRAFNAAYQYLRNKMELFNLLDLSVAHQYL